VNSRHRQSPTEGNLRAASPVKIRAAKIITGDRAGRFIGALTRDRIRHHGIWFDASSKDFSPSVRAQMFWGAYESAETRMIQNSLRNRTSVVELGSSLGVTTAHIAALMTPGGHLVCVEANPRLLPGLHERTLERAPSLKVDVVHAAVTDYCGSTTLVLASETVGSRIGKPHPDEKVIEVPALTLHEILRRTEVTDFDLVSDIEGAETSFLMTAPAVLKRCKRAVIELHETTVGDERISVPDLISAATAAGFTIIARHGPVLAFARSEE
jgi:FkbM family methyltransferase